MLSNIQAFILGIIQGLTEFLPISSTGHLYIGRHLFGLDEAGLFLDTMLHVGTLLAIIVVYKSELWKMICNPFSKLSLVMIVGTIPAVVIGLLFKDYFDEISKTGSTIGWEFLVTGFVLWFAEKAKKGEKNLEDIRYSDAFIIGSFQAAAIFPALSRSGLTIAAGLFRKLDRETAAYFSFLLSTPAILGGIVLQGKDIFSGQVESVTLTGLLFGTVASAIFGYLAIVGMVNFLKKRSLKIFAYYVWILGISIILLQTLGIF
ncbi:undecaprenyl-diphosphate phosphatase [Heyndrickxia sporothermodurans]|uniref:Undecaprenyl-diphosphatase n=1 Tax=Heyndrickxia sporothermodurans TaxID=46224 RepID=A0A150L872_9BACI|nr:undecaprenyl-diphosphate phosphatase [Heyndrickxia sporothermodurans]KYD08531.1 Undecaprenyl-diphosphatase [Heyndrickxia sporothermodurans]MBL5768549.1 undecaprenyl-diphosphate phosphatase [Heyndrickxia sporothermodurans]MBL5772229.1 undecaprenyl-diphosphate phosphatase [Heyndrickxia sporothermodurans]MBL5775802.1 undecaprenyl-diphosphate phosphatase [Heyndrickxia sporothermodurans]MBL5779326.1 undecaprenyl-diphosphate phosphatase [Heyndrickxia sporothermodurans]